MSLLTVEGLYNYDNTLFDGFNVPEGLVKQIAIDAILMRTRELEILYPDFDTRKSTPKKVPRPACILYLFVSCDYNF